MILKMSVEAIKLGLGKTNAGAELTLADEVRPRCLIPFSFYVGNVPQWEEKHGVKLADMRGRDVLVIPTEMGPATVGVGIKLQGEIAPDPAPSKAAK